MYAIYDTETGRISHFTRCAESIVAAQAGEGQSWIPVEDSVRKATHWINEGEVEERPVITLDDVPDGTLVFVNGQSYGPCNDGVVELEVDLPGSYLVRLEPPFPYQVYEEVYENQP